MKLKDRVNHIYDWSKDNDGGSLLLVAHQDGEGPKAYIDGLFKKLIKNKSYAGSSFSLSVSLLLCRMELSNGVTIYVASDEVTAKEVLSQTYLDWVGFVQDDGSIQMHETFFRGDLAQGKRQDKNVPPEMAP